VLLQQLVNGVMLGSTYALIAIGYTLVFGVLHLVHLAHGEVFMIGAFIGLFVVLWTGAGVVAALVGALVGAALLGILIELVAFRPIRARGGHVLAPMISTIGVGIVLQEVATRLFGSELVGFPHRLEPITLRLGPVTVTTVQLLILGVALVLMVALHVFVARSRLGMAMRATAESALTARLLGINTSRIILLTFAIASGLGGVAGVLVGLAFNAISPFMGIDMGVKGLAIMLIGGLGNIHGAMVGGMALGVIEVLSVAYLASSYRDAFAFAMMIGILLFRPQGLFGSRESVEQRV
jgi:branched-chain amino acid transport system permease protein